ncbi:MAG: oligosaccharide flippase family protein [Candidatus Paceibacterota bacterium]
MVYLASGGFWVGLRSGAGALISLGAMAAFAHLATQELYGEYQYVLATIGLVTVFGLPGMRSALVRSVARGFEGSLFATFKEKLRWSWIATLILVGVAGYYFFQDNTELGLVFMLAGVTFPVINSIQIFTQFWRGKQRFRPWAIAHILFQAFSMIAVVGALFFTDDSVLIIFASFFTVQIVTGSLLWYVTWSKRENDDVDPELISFGRHLTLMGAIGTVADRLDRIILWHVVGPVDLAVYSFARDPVNKVQGTLPIQTLALPKLSKNRVNSPGRKKKIFSKFLMLFVMTVPLAAVVALGAPFLYMIVFPQYAESVQYIPLLSVPIALLPFTVLSSSLTAEMKTRSMYIMRTTVPTVKIVLFLGLTPFFGIWGVAGALVASNVISDVLTTYFFWRM